MNINNEETAVAKNFAFCIRNRGHASAGIIRGHGFDTQRHMTNNIDQK